MECDEIKTYNYHKMKEITTKGGSCRYEMPSLDIMDISSERGFAESGQKTESYISIDSYTEGNTF